MTDIINEGKTKIIKRGDDPDSVRIISKDDITAGNGAKRATPPGKGILATETTCNVFQLLKDCRIPVAFIDRVDDTTFSAPFCSMLPYEVVVRREAHGSCLKRMPALTKGYRFPKLLVEFFLKTKGKHWKKYGLPCDDPFMLYSKKSGTISLHEDSKLFQKDKPFLVLKEKDVFSVFEEWKLFARMEEIARRVFRILEEAWGIAGFTLVDFKVEFGLTKDSTLLLADVIDNDSWRVIDEKGTHIDKQVYRDGADLDVVMEKYRHAAEETGYFLLNLKQISERCRFLPLKI